MAAKIPLPQRMDASRHCCNRDRRNRRRTSSSRLSNIVVTFRFGEVVHWPPATGRNWPAAQQPRLRTERVGAIAQLFEPILRIGHIQMHIDGILQPAGIT
jgi:hypothetical protein